MTGLADTATRIRDSPTHNASAAEPCTVASVTKPMLGAEKSSERFHFHMAVRVRMGTNTRTKLTWRSKEASENPESEFCQMTMTPQGKVHST